MGMAAMDVHRRFKSAIYGQFARIGKAVSNPGRLELLDLLCQGPRTVEALANEAGLSVANTSRHLHVLSGASLVEGRKSGLYVTYRIADPAVCRFFRGMRALSEGRLVEIERITRTYLGRRRGMDEGVQDWRARGFKVAVGGQRAVIKKGRTS